MKRFLVSIVLLTFIGSVIAQDLPSDVEKVYKGAEKLKSRKEYKSAINAYKEVLRSVSHIPSMESIAEISMELMTPPNYRMAYEYYDKAISELERQLAATTKRKEQTQIGLDIQRLTPKRNKAKSYVDDFDKAKDMKNDGNRLMDDKDLNEDAD
ncbi:MAG TPA: hypothetical protein DCQ26_19585 [Marinilabiliales bacterium]|jgi:tetratricopeptide (TPR) repeat protein|nr:MAG: hypothetical protein A2W95_07430 [Bacteroidetes bacterium GWA2_40_14]OFX59046.1 MAG: hypothetical protein A2W84_16590 [Bacteroidetes bacterium GWC2_40_13]OFX72240.1 MAG: hypothetical protein A2W96_17510 [Bacteroidetes bacterium GWD2_40_43]OFX90513.1 MAG: hypothetical protein A2W97_01890 [Bacteroidetes bacterium GWE2_40_63]OFY17242.1 MAG: hypothetical protein A2W88_14975 [Bacteroidetes bacterium GWF2_40_13]OFZ26525.1 MAG: hypothetical protein A2437_07520 [Bacteroidetes bacterium RIFOXYC